MHDRTDDALDPYGAIPLYMQLADALTREIYSGELPPNRRIPGELALASRWSVSRDTVRRAIAELRDRGLVVVSFGRGTFVVPELPDVE